MGMVKDLNVDNGIRVHKLPVLSGLLRTALFAKESDYDDDYDEDDE